MTQKIALSKASILCLLAFSLPSVAFAYIAPSPTLSSVSGAWVPCSEDGTRVGSDPRCTIFQLVMNGRFYDGLLLYAGTFEARTQVAAAPSDSGLVPMPPGSYWDWDTVLFSSPHWEHYLSGDFIYQTVQQVNVNGARTTAKLYFWPPDLQTDRTYYVQAQTVYTYFYDRLTHANSPASSVLSFTIPPKPKLLSAKITQLSPGEGVPVGPGDTIRYRILVSSALFSNTDVKITSNVPGNTTLAWQSGGTDTNSGTSAGSPAGTVLSWTQNSAGVGWGTYVDFNVKVGNYPTEATQICNYAGIVSKEKLYSYSSDTTTTCNPILPPTLTLKVCNPIGSATCATNTGSTPGSITVPYNARVGVSWSSTNIQNGTCSYTRPDGKTSTPLGNQNLFPGWGGYMTVNRDLTLTCRDLSGNSQSAVVSVTVDPVTGYVDGVTPAGTVNGWACQKKNPSSINVDLYVGGPQGTGTYIGSYLANQASSAAVATACETTGTAYRYSIPLSSATMQQHAGKLIYVYSISPTDGTNALLASSGTYKVPAPITITGVVDGVTSANAVYGWSCEKKNPSSINVHLYVGGPQGTYIGSYLANKASSAAVATECQSTGTTYRYSIPLSSATMTAHAGKLIYVYGISPTPGGTNALLTKSGTFAVPTVPATTTLSASPSPCPSASTSTACTSKISWTTPSQAQIWYTPPSGTPKLFSCAATTGSKNAAFIYPKRSYVFNLYKTATCTDSVTGKTPDATVTVKGILSTSANAPFTHTLAKGWTGEEVTTLQASLAKLGFYTGEVTGYFGSLTEAAVKSLQAQNNIAAVGIVGPQTRSLLQRLLGY